MLLEDEGCFEEFLKSDSQFEYLTIENWILEFFEQKFEINERLIYLSIEVYEIKPIFDN